MTTATTETQQREAGMQLQLALGACLRLSFSLIAREPTLSSPRCSWTH